MSDSNAEEIAKLVEAFNKLKYNLRQIPLKIWKIGLRHLVSKQKLKSN